MVMIQSQVGTNGPVTRIFYNITPNLRLTGSLNTDVAGTKKVAGKADEYDVGVLSVGTGESDGAGRQDQRAVPVQVGAPPRDCLQLRTPEGRKLLGACVRRSIAVLFQSDVTVFNLAQFDNESGSLGWQMRVRWILRPGREVFIVFNQGWIREEDETGNSVFRAGDTRLAAKAQYTMRFWAQGLTVVVSERFQTTERI